MSNDLSPENEQFIAHALESGAYASRNALLDDAIRLLKRRRELQRDIEAGINSGPSISGDEVLDRLESRAQEIAERSGQ